MDWWNVSFFGLIPVLSVIIVFIINKRWLWIAPVVSTVLSFLISIIAMPMILSVNEYRGFLLWATILHFGIVTILTMITYFVLYILKRKR